MAIYLTELAAICRSAGLTVKEEPGWQSRARVSGGYAPGRPTHIMCHHTASPPSSDGQPDVNFMTYRAEARPLANLYLSRAGKVWVMAAGCTNTNGLGRDRWNGGVPNNSMNSYAIGIEAGNTGTGEPWPDAQQSAYLTLVAALCSHYGIAEHHVRGHQEWAPDRKIDPAGPSRFGSINSSGTWNMDTFRAAITADPPPLPPPGDEPMALLTRYTHDNTIWVVAEDFSWRYQVSQETHDSIKGTGRYSVVYITPGDLEAVPS